MRRGCRFLFFLWGQNQNASQDLREGTLKLLGVDLTVLVQSMSLHAGDHVDLCVARIALEWPSGRRG